MESKTKALRYAVVGCLHGQLTLLYDSILEKDKESGQRTELLLICGDFQAIRHTHDLKTIAIPPRHLKDTGDFWEYFTGKKKAPILTIFIGGNHEASEYMRELHFGGFVAENIYYIGTSGSILVNDKLRIVGLSGIFKNYGFYKPHPKYPFYNESDIRDCYHIRQLEVFKLSLLNGKIDIGLSHDWPRGAHQYGDLEELIKCKPFFGPDVGIH